MNKGTRRTSGVGQRSDGTEQHHYVSKLRDLPGFGRVYLAFARDTEAPAIVQAYTGRQQPLPAGLELLVSTGDEPRNLTVEVRGTGGPLVDALEDASNLLDAALSRPETMTHLQRRRRARGRTHRTAWLGWASAGVSLSLAAGLALCLLSRDAQPPGESHEPIAQASVPKEAVEDVPLPTEVASWANVLGSSSDREPLTIRKRYVIPDKPLKGQDTPPCLRGHVAINGGCWVRLKDDAPNCPEGSAEYKGGCYLPVKGEKPGSVSIDRSRP
ncbi:hypothetical protein [Pyxidicoccus caerfyrddinensis]|uniref:hypothetical protein n=1 Tax=Pyxidicoccus caerfyrddinensis TaxID=2709663 RepID=UPI0013DBD5DA|nr:hypothetical protein [Pyxidicoccus caerfyrddinensis]